MTSQRIDRWAFVGALLVPGAAAAQAPTYAERYRPQFHFTPATNWANDPDVRLFARGGTARLVSLEAWPLASVWTGVAARKED